MIADAEDEEFFDLLDLLLLLFDLSPEEEDCFSEDLLFELLVFSLAEELFLRFFEASCDVDDPEEGGGDDEGGLLPDDGFEATLDLDSLELEDFRSLCADFVSFDEDLESFEFLSSFDAVDLDSLDADLGSLDVDLASLEADLGSLDVDLMSLEADLRSFEADLGPLEAALGSFHEGLTS